MKHIPMRSALLFLFCLALSFAAFHLLKTTALAKTDPRELTAATAPSGEPDRGPAATDLEPVGLAPFYFVLGNEDDENGARLADWDNLSLVHDAGDAGLADIVPPLDFPRGPDYYTTQDILVLFGLSAGSTNGVE